MKLLLFWATIMTVMSEQEKKKYHKKAWDSAQQSAPEKKKFHKAWERHDNTKIAFLHVRRTGGSSIWGLLKRNFLSPELRRHCKCIMMSPTIACFSTGELMTSDMTTSRGLCSDPKQLKLREEEIRRVVEVNKCPAIELHHWDLSVAAELKRRGYMIVTFLRHPLQRMLSSFNYEYIKLPLKHRAFHRGRFKRRPSSRALSAANDTKIEWEARPIRSVPFARRRMDAWVDEDSAARDSWRRKFAAARDKCISGHKSVAQRGASDGVMLEIPVLRNASSEVVDLFREWLQFQSSPQETMRMISGCYEDRFCMPGHAANVPTKVGVNNQLHSADITEVLKSWYNRFKIADPLICRVNPTFYNKKQTFTEEAKGLVAEASLEMLNYIDVIAIQEDWDTSLQVLTKALNLTAPMWGMHRNSYPHWLNYDKLKNQFPGAKQELERTLWRDLEFYNAAVQRFRLLAKSLGIASQR